MVCVHGVLLALTCVHVYKLLHVPVCIVHIMHPSTCTCIYELVARAFFR